MASCKLLVLICAIFAATYAQDTNVALSAIPPQPHTDQPTTPISTTSPTTPIPAPTTKPTTKPPHTTATTKPTPTPTTTTKPTPTPSPTTTTKPTPKPSPTTTTKPTPTPSPTTTTKPTTTPPTPQPNPGNPGTGNWTLNYTNTHRICVMVDAAVQFEVLETGSNNSYKINLPTNATVSGECKPDAQKLMLSWGNGNSIQWDFLKTNNSKFELKDVQSKLNLTLYRKAPQVYNLTHAKAEFETPLKMSYKCAKIETLKLAETDQKKNETFALLHISHLQFQAFKNSTEHSFDSAMDCEGGSITSDTVPIVVGCVLAIMVILVLAAYLIGRRRCQARGYLSM